MSARRRGLERGEGAQQPERARRVAHRRSPGPPDADADRLVAPDQPRQHRHAVPRRRRARPGHADRPAHDRGRGARPRRWSRSRPRSSTRTSPISGVAVGSGSTRDRDGRANMRGAAAAARRRCSSSPRRSSACRSSSLTVDKGVVSGGGKRVKYADLIAGKLFDSTIAAHERDADRAGERVQGDRHARRRASTSRRSSPASTTYIQNVRVPGMLHGRVVRPRGQGAVRPGRERCSRRRGLDQAHRRRAGRRARATSSASSRRRSTDAIQAAAQLKVKWDETPKLPGNGNLAERAARPGERRRRRRRGRQPATSAPASRARRRRVSASYFTGYQAHVPIGPNCRGRRRRGDRRDGALHRRRGRTRLRSRDRGARSSCRRRRCASRSTRARAPTATAPTTTPSISAALMSQAVGKPVRVQFMRWDEHGWDQFGPAQVDRHPRRHRRERARSSRYDYTVAGSHGWTQVVESAHELAGMPLLPATAPAATSTRQRRRVLRRSRTAASRASRVNGYNGFLKGIWLRAPGAPQATFASEQMIDELAHAAGHRPDRVPDPEHRRDQSTTTPAGSACSTRSRKAAELEAEVSRARSSTERNVVTGRGVAIGGFANAYPAIVADITVNKKTGKITSTTSTRAQDAGLAVNPASSRTRWTGCLVQGCSRALIEEVRFTKTRVDEPRLGHVPDRCASRTRRR